MPCAITQCYLPPDSGDFPAFTPAEAGTRFSNPGGMQGWVALMSGYISRWFTGQRRSPISEIITKAVYREWELKSQPLSRVSDVPTTRPPRPPYQLLRQQHGMVGRSWHCHVILSGRCWHYWVGLSVCLYVCLWVYVHFWLHTWYRVRHCVYRYVWLRASFYLYVCSEQVVPVEGLQPVNDEQQKSFEEILPEIVISK